MRASCLTSCSRFSAAPARLARLPVDKLHGQSSACVFRAAPGVVRLRTAFRIARVARVQRSVRATNHVDEMQGSL